ncbi:MAG: Adenylate cyclase [uncultured bacterium]|nr:MAG: Adenylate cyclase [uncultured bacterium]HBG21124.1 hypothetical protein [Desulfobulbaceae bacterium]
MEKDLVRASILLVDDEFVIRKSLAKELRAERFAVTDVASGIDAIGALQKLQFNIVITDLMMEGIDGFGVLKAVKELAPLTRIIVITGYGDLRTAIDAMHLGADDFLVKPFEIEELIFRIRRCLEKRNLIEMLMEKTQQLEKEIQRRGNIEERLMQNDNRFRLALDVASNGVWDRNLSTGETHHGENWYRTLGYSHDETPVFEEILHPEDRERVLKLGEEHISGKTPLFEAELRLRNKAGDWHWVLSRGRVVEWDEQGRAVRIVGTITDINRLKQLEARLLRAQEELRRKVQERTEELQATQLALQRAQREADEAQQFPARIFGRLELFCQQLEDSSVTERQRELINGLRTDLDNLRPTGAS